MADLSTIKDCVVEIDDLLNEVTQRLTRVKKQKTKAKKSDDIAVMKNRMDRLRKSLKTMRVEIRELSKGDQKPHNEKATQLEEKINQLGLDIEWYEKDEPESSSELDHHQIIGKAQKIQEDDIQILARVTRQVKDTKQVGADTLVTMAQQGNQIKKIDTNVDEVEANVKVANRHLRTIVRR